MSLLCAHLDCWRWSATARAFFGEYITQKDPYTDDNECLFYLDVPGPSLIEREEKTDDCEDSKIVDECFFTDAQVLLEFVKDCVGEYDVEVRDEPKQHIDIAIYHITEIDFCFHSFVLFLFF